MRQLLIYTNQDISQSHEWLEVISFYTCKCHYLLDNRLNGWSFSVKQSEKRLLLNNSAGSLFMRTRVLMVILTVWVCDTQQVSAAAWCCLLDDPLHTPLKESRYGFFEGTTLKANNAFNGRTVSISKLGKDRGARHIWTKLVAQQILLGELCSLP